ncbi:glycosyltransferase family 4 protein [Fervidobacterium riparium]|nr:hypothetical protein IB67_01645 [Fervidobacterium riparium]
MKIVHISQYYNDGYGYQENILPYYQALLGHEVVHITSDRMSAFVPLDKRIVGVKNYIDNNVKIIRLPTKGEFKGRFVLFKGLYETLKEERPDYIFHHGLTSPSLFTAAKYKRNYGTFLAVDNHSDINISGRNIFWRIGYYEFLWKSLLKGLYKDINVIFGVTPLRCEFPVKYLGAPENKVRLLPIGLDLRNIPPDSKSALRQKYGFKDEDVLIITGGKITPEKKMSNILKAFNMLCEELSNIKLLIIGKILDKEVENLARLNNNIIYMGWKNRKETLEILKMSDIAIWNTQHTTLIEDALAAGNILILRYYGSTAHFIDNNGMYLFSNSVKEIYDKIKIIVQNKGLMQKMSEETQKMINILSYENIAKESIEYYYDLRPRYIHNYFMNDKFLDKNYGDYEKII